MAPTRHTLANIRETGDFVVNLPGEELLAQLMVCAKPLPLGVSEIKEAGLHEEKAKTVTSPRIRECFGWFECKLREIVAAGDHQLVLGDILRAEAAEKVALPLLHIGGADFSLPGKALKAGSK
jgi:flavin reductase (DIM6/NTAB) family NADH-FMN oxidoreductase RutF